VKEVGEGAFPHAFSQLLNLVMGVFRMNPTASSPVSYRPSIDGLRSLAIGSVFLFHLKHSLLPGGFVGVDVFFVISGYLITSIIVRDCEADAFSLAKFYQRRIARIFPAFITIAIAALIGAYFVYSPQDFASAGANLTAATLSVANMKFIWQGNYFEISQDAQPFLHCWSLSVEEQFYVFFPVVLWGVYKLARKHALLLMAGLWVMSFAACVILTKINPTWAFFLLPTRAYELLAGCILAIYAGQPDSCRRPLFPASASMIGLLLIGASFFLIHESNQFPGFQAALPVLGAVCVLWPNSETGSMGEKLLSLPPLVFLGRLSYSLYLWHWPIFSLVDYKMVLATESTRVAWKVGLSLVAATGSFLLIEKPGRLFLNRRDNRWIAFAFLIVSVPVCALLGVAVRKENYVAAEMRDVAKGGIAYNQKSKTGSLILMGDSNGSMYGKMMKDVANDLGYKLNVISVDGGDPLPLTNGRSGKLWLDSLAVVHRENPDFLFLVCSWSAKLGDDRRRLEIAIDALKQYAGCIVLITQPPILPSQANRAAMRDGARPPFFEDRKIRSGRERANDYLGGIRSERVSTINIESHFSGDGGMVFFLDKEGRQLYHDQIHLSGYGADLVKKDILDFIKKKEISLDATPAHGK